MPGVGILPSYSMKIRTGSFRTPKKWMIIDKFSSFGIFTVSLGLRTERPNHLRMTIHATLSYIKITSMQLKRSIRFHTRYRRHVRFDQKRRHHFNEATNENCYE